MLGIVTAFRSRALAKDWDYDVWLLERTLDSILAQTDDRFVVAVVCHEQPTVAQASHPKVKFLPVDFAPPRRIFDDMCVDKVLKLSVGIEWVLAKGCKYVMITDADDLVNRRMSEFVAGREGANGWYTPFTLFHAYGSPWLKKFSCDHMVSTPCAIVRSDLLKFVTPPFSGDWLNMILAGGEKPYAEMLASRGRKVNTLAAAGLAHFQRLMTADGHPLEPLPFLGTIMINHIDSMSFVPGGLGSLVSDTPHRSLRGQLGRLKRFGVSLPSLRLLTHKLRKEFSIPAPTAIPIKYRQKGTVFSRDS
jgi:hypothetical protein